MNTELLLMGILPLVLFMIADSLRHATLGVALALVVSVGLCFWAYMRLGTVDEFMIIGISCLLALGTVSIIVKKTVFFKIAPVLSALIITGVMAYFYFFDTPLFVKLSPQIEALAPPQQREIISSDVFQQALHRLSLHLLWFVPAHAAFVGYAALKRSSLFWMFSRLAFYPGLFGIMFLTFAG